MSGLRIIPTSLGEFLTSSQGIVAGAFVALAIAWFSFYRRHRSLYPPITAVLIVLAGGLCLTVGAAMLAYPFFAIPPDLGRVEMYLPFAGVALLWVAVSTIRREIERSGDDNSDD